MYTTGFKGVTGFDEFKQFLPKNANGCTFLNRLTDKMETWSLTATGWVKEEPKVDV